MQMRGLNTSEPPYVGSYVNSYLKFKMLSGSLLTIACVF